jgi:hypothetical protein
MMEELYIVLNCFVCIFILWLLTIITLSIVLSVLSSHIKRKKMGINIILAQKYDLSVVLAKELKEHNISLPVVLEEELNLNKNNFDKYNTIEINLVGKKLSETISSLLEASSQLKEENSRVNKLVNSLQDVEKQHRHLIISVNNVIAGYNYWVRFIPYRPISKLFRIKTIRNAE